ncbi:hypothetical protein [Salimicrobium flavidum]|uniref:Uncharacterized protein n=1 Tax=Salimicrobium flavidum TaxID=570947 RepID=A0A1N7IX24_9BACI|nr:hypothetical protein [Salimicrobium flavidum]SIS41541.1 hypothetical protein SAMN05421687_102379 [Salimicrobium flavidum]
MQKSPVLEEWSHILVPSSHGEWKDKKRHYRLSYGLVSWRGADPEGQHIACFPMVQFGETEDYKEAIQKGEIVTTYPCHVLLEDRENVKAAEDILIKKMKE